MTTDDKFFSNWFVIDYQRWLRLGAFYDVSAYKAYKAYLELCALDEHHFSEGVREVSRINKAIADRVLWSN